MRRILSVSATLAVAFGAAMLGARTAAAVGESDRVFVNELGRANAAEIKLAKLAQEKGSNEAVKDFANHMVEDHTKAANELKQVAKNLGLTVAEDPTDAQRKTAERLEKLSGADFDRDYSRVMLDEHKKTVALLRGHSCDEHELAQFQEKTLPILEHHLKMAEALVAKVGAAPANPKSPPNVETP